MRYAIGSRVQVKVSRVDLDGRRIDLLLTRHSDGVVSRALKDKEGSHTEIGPEDLDERLGVVKRIKGKPPGLLGALQESAVPAIKKVARRSADKSKVKGRQSRGRS
jgi:ribonuclease R